MSILVKYRHARASGYTPPQAIAYARGGQLPIKPVSAYMAAITAQRQDARVQRAYRRMFGPSALLSISYRTRWNMAWEGTRRAAWEANQIQEAPPLSTSFRYYVTTAEV